MKRLNLFFVISFFVAVGLNAQCLMYPVGLGQRIPQSSSIIEGKVVNQKAFWNTSHDLIYTSNLVEVYKSFKNSAPAYIEVITEGGIVGFDKQVVHPALELKIGDVGVFTLNQLNLSSQFGKQVFEAYASEQGFIRYDVVNDVAHEPFFNYQQASTTLYNTITQLTGQPYLVVKSINPFLQTLPNVNTTQAVAAISSFSPTTITAGTFSVLTINGSGFGSTPNASLIAFKNANDGGATTVSPIASQIVSWTNTQIQVEVPTRAGTGIISVNGSSSSSILTIPYAHLSVTYTDNIVYTTKHINQSGGGYTWTYNTTFNSNAPAKAAFERSLQTWRCATYINWPVASTTTTINTAAQDGTNIVTFSSSLPTGVLGRCTSYFGGCDMSGTLYWFVDELDIVFDDTPGSLSWQFGPAAPSLSQYDFESVTVHELGHGHQLGHVINSSDLMHYSLTNGQQKRNLNADDLNGGLAVMVRNAQSGGTCGNPLMTPLNASNCTLGAPTASISSVASACVNTPITLTDASNGNPTSWSWSMPGGTPSSSTSQNTSVTYSTTGVKTISLTVANANGTNTAVQTITISNSPTVTPAFTSTTICRGQSKTQTVSGASTYTWLPSGSGVVSVLSPTATTVYTVTGTSGGCMSAPTLFTINVTPTPTVTTAFTSTTICNGQSRTQTLSGASTYTWLPSGSGASSVLSPTATTVYTVTGATGACVSAAKNFTINVTPTPTVTTAFTTTTICRGQSKTQTLTGASTYTWLPSGSGASSVLSPTSTTVYTVTGTNSGCVSSAKNFTINVTPTPTVTTAFTNTSICKGQSATQTLSGASTYTWLPSGSGTSSVLSPTITTTYTVTGTSSGCVSSAKLFTVSIKANPVISYTNTNPSCFGQCNGVLNSSGSGATAPYTYQLSQSSVVCTSASCTALCAGSYTLQVTSANGCSTSTVVSLTQPTQLSATASSTNASCSSCTNGAVSASASGGTSPYTYSWTPVAANTPTVGNLAVGCYTVFITDAKGCVDTQTTCVSFSTKIEELQQSTSHLSMYPNPNNGIFTVSSIQLEERMNIEITNTMGQVVSNENFRNVTQVNVNLSSFAKGVYYVKVNTKDGTQLFKLLIQ